MCQGQDAMDGTGRKGRLGMRRRCQHGTCVRRDLAAAPRFAGGRRGVANPHADGRAGTSCRGTWRSARKQVSIIQFGRFLSLSVVIALLSGCLEQYDSSVDSALVNWVLSEIWLPPLSRDARDDADPRSEGAQGRWDQVPAPISLNNDALADNQLANVFAALPSAIRSRVWIRWQRAWAQPRRSIFVDVAPPTGLGVREVRLRGAVRLVDAYRAGPWVAAVGLPSVRLTASVQQDDRRTWLSVRVPPSDARQLVYVPLDDDDASFLLPLYVHFVAVEWTLDSSEGRKGMLQGVVPLQEGRSVIAGWLAHLLNREFKGNPTDRELRSFIQNVQGLRPSGMEGCAGSSSGCCPDPGNSSDGCALTAQDLLRYGPLSKALVGDIPLPMSGDGRPSGPSAQGLSWAVGVVAGNGLPIDECGESGWCMSRDLCTEPACQVGDQRLLGLAWREGRLWVTGTDAQIWRREQANWTPYTVGSFAEYGNLSNIAVGADEQVWVLGKPGLVHYDTAGRDKSTPRSTTQVLPGMPTVTDHGCDGSLNPWVVTWGGDIMRLQGKSWGSAEQSPPDRSSTPGAMPRLLSIYVPPEGQDLAWVAGEQGYVARVERGKRSPLPAGLSGDTVVSLWAYRPAWADAQDSPPDTVYAVTNQGACWVLAGPDWRPCGMPAGVTLVTSISGTGPSDVWAVTRRGQIVHFDGQAWRVVGGMPKYLTGAALSLTRILAVEGTDLWAVGQWMPRDATETRRVVLHCSRRNGADACVDTQ